MSPVQKTIWIDAPMDIVHSYFTDGDKMAQWAGRAATLEPRPGGLYRLDMGAGGVIEGQFLEVTATRIVQRVGTQETTGTFRIVITLSPEATGTRVDITHEGLVPPFSQIAARGWDHHLARLSVVANGGTVGPDSLCDKPMQDLA
ncbi:hypothetical protein ACMU_05570 [Actibacterium mucosum KCTC 23349]|uniref:Activator of Hsp90 ATPase homologue 1/2-like C-terminal domain-containing protein n=1 Tax=Actibacterium mucosum KCTC 23349 TaxID=1454373 RepID=A0A037ZK08_9RHOB|nr:SRPBCC domain-containing protein [Actibacterium mucosum]KAJ56413.1 hypothetical protein ACMU_05570 [Actibacterium mucosum KCTC 23349]